MSDLFSSKNEIQIIVAYTGILSVNTKKAHTHLIDIVGVKTSLWEPERDILVAQRVLGVRVKLDYFSSFELASESFIIGPEQANIRDGEEHHC